MKARRAALAGLVSNSQRREAAWAWLSLVTLILCWDASARLDERVSPPRVRIAHAGDSADQSAQNALMPVSARPTVN
jgi:hypothetical protein